MQRTAAAVAEQRVVDRRVALAENPPDRLVAKRLLEQVDHARGTHLGGVIGAKLLHHLATALERARDAIERHGNVHHHDTGSLARPEPLHPD